MSHFGKGNGYYCQECPKGGGLTPVDPKHAPSGTVQCVRCNKTQTALESTYALMSRNSSQGPWQDAPHIFSADPGANCNGLFLALVVCQRSYTTPPNYTACGPARKAAGFAEVLMAHSFADGVNGRLDVPACELVSCSQWEPMGATSTSGAPWLTSASTGRTPLSTPTAAEATTS